MGSGELSHLVFYCLVRVGIRFWKECIMCLRILLLKFNLHCGGTESPMLSRCAKQRALECLSIREHSRDCTLRLVGCSSLAIWRRTTGSSVFMYLRCPNRSWRNSREWAYISENAQALSSKYLLFESWRSLDKCHKVHYAMYNFNTKISFHSVLQPCKQSLN